jgi:hypothetical protein
MDSPMDDSRSGPAPGQSASFGAPEARRQRPLMLRQMGIGELLDGAIRLYRLEWKVLMGIVAFVLVPITFIQLWIAQALVSGIDPIATPTSDALGQVLLVGLAIFAIQFLIVQPFLVAAVARAAADIYLGEPVSIGRVYRFALARLLPILWITVISTVAILIGLVLLIIPGIILLVRLAFAPAVLVVESVGGMSALRRSWRLSSGNFWRALGAIVLSGVISAVVSGIISLPAEYVVQSLGPDAWPISALGTALASVLTTPFAMLVIVLLYFDLRIRNEGYDIEVMARELATER